jgi:hypothetical protein
MQFSQQHESSRARWPFVVGLIIGVALVLAPVGFQMFTRAPQGGTMITSFKPYMTEKTIGGFQADLETINAAVEEARAKVSPAASSTPAAYDALLDQWDHINSSMGSMLTTMGHDIGDYRAVAALPPFPLFPWFFVAPGVLLVGISSWGLLRRRAGRSARAALIALAVLGLGIFAAPAIFQMWSRAPKGGQMITDFVPLMTQAKVGQVQGYFLVLAEGEEAFRLHAVPSFAAQSGLSPQAAAQALPAITAFSERWPAISATMAPMIGAMSNNLDNYAAVRAMPPFPLFPWFFAIPGVIVTAAALGGLLGDRRRRHDDATPAASPSPDTEAFQTPRNGETT